MAADKVEVAAEELVLEDVRCPVCLLVNLEPVIFPTCSHNMCVACAAHWLDNKRNCPMCRGGVDEICLDEMHKNRVSAYLSLHPEQETSSDTKYLNTVHEIIFWATQQRKNFDDPDMIFCGKKPTLPDTMSEHDKKEYLLKNREEKISERIDTIKGRLEEQMNAYIATLREEGAIDIVSEEPAAEIQKEDDDREWRIVPGRGLLHVPRSTHRNQCPIRFRRSHSA